MRGVALACRCNARRIYDWSECNERDASTFIHFPSPPCLRSFLPRNGDYVSRRNKIWTVTTKLGTLGKIMLFIPLVLWKWSYGPFPFRMHCCPYATVIEALCVLHTKSIGRGWYLIFLIALRMYFSFSNSTVVRANCEPDESGNVKLVRSFVEHISRENVYYLRKRGKGGDESHACNRENSRLWTFQLVHRAFTCCTLLHKNADRVCSQSVLSPSRHPYFNPLFYLPFPPGFSLRDNA